MPEPTQTDNAEAALSDVVFGAGNQADTQGIGTQVAETQGAELLGVPADLSLEAWLTGPFDGSPLAMGVRLCFAFACGYVIAIIYKLVKRGERYPKTFPATLVLLAILCAMLPLVIGQNIAWAFGLVGALSIVRFRTAVDDTHDITFVIFAVLVGMAVGADRLTVALVGIFVTGIAAFVVRPWRRTPRASTAERLRPMRLTIRIGIGNAPSESIQPILAELAERFELLQGTVNKQGVALELIYNVAMKDAKEPTTLIERLNLVDGVQSVKLRRNK